MQSEGGSYLLELVACLVGTLIPGYTAIYMPRAVDRVRHGLRLGTVGLEASFGSRWYYVGFGASLLSAVTTSMLFSLLAGKSIRPTGYTVIPFLFAAVAFMLFSVLQVAIASVIGTEYQTRLVRVLGLLVFLIPPAALWVTVCSKNLGAR